MKNLYKQGDTIIEVIFAITIFTLVAVLSITLMNSGIATAQTSLETEMARNEVDAQAEALRFIHNNFVAELALADGSRIWENLWNQIIDERRMMDPRVIGDIGFSDIGNVCRTEEAYSDMIGQFMSNIFVINTRFLDPTRPNNTIFTAGQNATRFGISGLYPRIIFRSLGADSDDMLGGDMSTAIARVEGLWILPVHSDAMQGRDPEFFDFYINTCWSAPGRARPASIGTIVRLYNPNAR